MIDGHINWTDTDQNLVTTGSGTFGSLIVDDTTLDANTLTCAVGGLTIEVTEAAKDLTLEATDDIYLTPGDDIIIAAGGAFNITAGQTSNLQTNGGDFGLITTAGDIEFLSSGVLNLQTQGDNTDYIQFTTVADVPAILTVSNCNLRIEPSSGTVDFGGSKLTTIDSITGEQLTSTDDITMAGVLLNTMAAADVTGLNIDGATNDRTYDGVASETVAKIYRDVGGSASVLGQIYTLFDKQMIFDFDYSGDVVSNKLLYGDFAFITYTGDIVFTGGILPVSSFYAKGSYAFVNMTSASALTCALDNKTFTYYQRGADFEAWWQPTINYSGANGAVVAEVIGGRFKGATNPTLTAGTLTTTAYGGHFTGEGTATGDSTAIGGWFSGTGGDTNYGVYSNAGSNVFIASVTDTCVGAETDLHIDDSDGHIGPSSSSEKYKENIRDVDDADVVGLCDLRARKFDAKDGTARDTIGLIAEEVEAVMPKIVRYKKNIIYRDEIITDPNGKEIVEQHFDHFETTNEPDGINYSKLIVPMLKEVQKLRAEVDELKVRN